MKCKFFFSKRIPSSDELQKNYETYGRNDYLSPITIKRYNELLDYFKRYRRNNRILDVGCGIGYFLEIAKKRGWDVYGSEYTEEAVETCTKKGILMNLGALKASDYESNFFDIITSFEVIEHINNPVSEIKTIHQILRPGSLVYLTTPNFNSLSRYILKDKWDIIRYPEHLCYYTPSTLFYLLTQYNSKAVICIIFISRFGKVLLCHRDL